MFREKPWTNLRKKIVSKQGNQVPEPVEDNRTPYQIRTEAPMEPGLCLLEINDHIKKAMGEIDEFLRNRSRDTQAFLPLSLSKKVTEHYGSSLKPNFDLDPELATQLEGLLSGVAFSGLGKKASSFSSVDLGRMGQVTFNIVEIISFLMASIAIMDEGLSAAEEKSKGPALSILQEHKPFLGSMDKACRHLIKESLALMATIMVRQRSILGSTFSAGLPNSFRNKVLKSPLSHFDVTPSQVMSDVKNQYDTFIQNRAFASAVARLGNVPAFRGAKKSGKKRLSSANRGGRGQPNRYLGSFSSSRGVTRGTLRGVRRATFKNVRGFARRDRALRDIEAPRGRASTSGAGFSADNRP